MRVAVTDLTDDVALIVVTRHVNGVRVAATDTSPRERVTLKNKVQGTIVRLNEKIGTQLRVQFPVDERTTEVT